MRDYVIMDAGGKKWLVHEGAFKRVPEECEVYLSNQMLWKLGNLEKSCCEELGVTKQQLLGDAANNIENLVNIEIGIIADPNLPDKPVHLANITFIPESSALIFDDQKPYKRELISRATLIAATYSVVKIIEAFETEHLGTRNYDYLVKRRNELFETLGITKVETFHKRVIN